MEGLGLKSFQPEVTKATGIAAGWDPRGEINKSHEEGETNCSLLPELLPLQLLPLWVLSFNLPQNAQSALNTPICRVGVHLPVFASQQMETTTNRTCCPGLGILSLFSHALPIVSMQPSIQVSKYPWDVPHHRIRLTMMKIPAAWPTACPLLAGYDTDYVTRN